MICVNKHLYSKSIWIISSKLFRRSQTLHNVNQPPNSTNILPDHISRRVHILPRRFTAYFLLGILKHMPNKNVSMPWVVVACGLALIYFWVYYKACATSPGEITKENYKSYIAKYKQYYDGELYK